MDGGTLLAHLAQRRDRGEVPSTEFADQGEPRCRRAAARREQAARGSRTFQGRLDAGGGAAVAGAAAAMPGRVHVRTKHPFKKLVSFFRTKLVSFL